MSPAELVAHLNEHYAGGWRAGDRGAAKGLARVWYYPTTNRYGAQFRNGVSGAISTADGRTPDEALGKVLRNALRFARMTIDDIEAIKPGYTK